MKRLAVLALAALLILPVYAHGGRTDANGGHYDSSTGEYHYHHGYPAHQHVNGTCPYNFDDKTDRNNDSSGGTAQNQDSKSNSDDGRTVIPSEIIWGCIVVIGYLICNLLSYLDKKNIEKSIEKRNQDIEKRNQDIEKRKWEIEKEQLISKYGHMTKNQIASMCGMPDALEIGPDGLPKEIGAMDWGKSMTFFVSRTGYSYHRIETCTQNATIPEHAANIQSKVPCQKCHPNAPTLEWFWTYQDIMSQLEKYGVTVETDSFTDETQ